MRRAVRAIGGVLTISLLVTLTVAIGSAGAATKHVVGVLGEGVLGSNGPRGVAVNDTTGDVYVVDGGVHLVRRYSAGGVELPGLGTGSASNAKGAFNSPTGVAVDQATGDVWVTDANNNRIQRFAAPNAFDVHDFDIAFGWDVTSGGTTGFEVCTAADTCKQGLRGAGAGQFGSNLNGSPAFHPSGRVYVADQGNRRLQRFDAATGAFDAALGDSALFPLNAPSRVAIDSVGGIYLVEPGASVVNNNSLLKKCFLVGAGDGLSCVTFAGPQLNGEFPFAVAIDKTDDHVYVAVFPAEPGQDQKTVDVLVREFEPDGDFVAEHGADAQMRTSNTTTTINNWGNLAVNSTTGAVYVSVPTGAADSRRIYVLDDRPASGSIDLVKDVTAGEATFDGVVNPNGVETSFYFETSDDGGDTWTRVADPVHVGSESVAVGVSQSASGLEPNRETLVRLVASRRFNADAVVGTALSFTTDPAPPEVTTFPAARVTDSTARLDGKVDANSQSTTYRFEYGTDTGYGASVPVGGMSAGNAKSPVAVSQKLSGLEPATTYHYRLVATNASGTEASGDRSFTTATTPPDPAGDRVIELVTHPGESAGQITRGTVSAWTEDGTRVLFASVGVAMDADDVNGALLAYRAERGDGGWRQSRMSPRFAGAQDGGSLDSAAGSFIEGWSDDYRTAIWRTQRALVPGDSVEPFVYRYYRVEDGGETVASLGLTGMFDFWGAASPDGRKHLWSTVSPLVAEDTAPFDLYINDNGEVRLFGLAPDGSQFDCGANLGFEEDPYRVARDWSRVFFDGTSCASVPRVYMREGGHTTEVAASQCSRPDCDSPQPTEFVAGSEDGSRVLVASGQQLTDDDTDAFRDLYVHDVDSGELARVSGPETGGTAGVAEAIVAVSSDLRRVYFVSRGVPDGDPAATLGQPNVYLWDDGDLAHVATLSEDDAQNWAFRFVDRTAEATPNGGKLLFDSTLPLTADDLDSARDVYVYDAASDAVSRVSIGEADAGNGAHDATLPPDEADRLRRRARGRISADGRRAFFVTDESLVPEDRNSIGDIYENLDGSVRLVSTGRGDATTVEWIGASTDGSTVFMLTGDPLSPQDLDNGVSDIYAARVGGGGFAAPSPVPAPCEGDACQGATSGAPLPPVPGSRSFALDEPSAPRARVALRVRPGAVGLRAAVLRVRVGAAGRLVVRGPAVRNRVLRVPSAGTYRVKVMLSRKGRRALARRKSLHARLRVVLRPHDGAASRVPLTLRFKARGRR